MNWIEWFITGIFTGIFGLALAIFECSYYVITHMDKYGPRMMKIMMKRSRNGKSQRSYSGSGH